MRMKSKSFTQGDKHARKMFLNLGKRKAQNTVRQTKKHQNFGLNSRPFNDKYKLSQ